MHVPRFWFRAAAGDRCCLGWSDTSSADAERMARQRLAKVQQLNSGARSPNDWDYYPATPVKEEIVESPKVDGCAVLVTRNRAGVLVLNTDAVAFVDVDLPAAPAASSSVFARLFKKPADTTDHAEAALTRARLWAENGGALLRAYRTARGLRLLRLDRRMDPSADETDRMFSALGTDPQYQRLCRIQKSFRARLTPKPRRVGLTESPGRHPRTDGAVQRAFAEWLSTYKEASRGRAVCSLVAQFGSGEPLEAASRVAEMHDRMTLQEGCPLA